MFISLCYNICRMNEWMRIKGWHYNKNFPLYFFRGNVFGILMSDVNIDRNHDLNENSEYNTVRHVYFFVLQYSYQYFISLQQYYSAPLLISPGIFLGPRGILLAAVVNFRLKLPPPLRKLPPPPRPLEKLLPLRPLDVLKIIVWISMIFHICSAMINYLNVKWYFVISLYLTWDYLPHLDTTLPYVPFDYTWNKVIWNFPHLQPYNFCFHGLAVCNCSKALHR